MTTQPNNSNHRASDQGAERLSIDQLAQPILASYAAHEAISHIDGPPMPCRRQAIEWLELLRELFFPGYFTTPQMTSHNMRDHVMSLLAQIREQLEWQVAVALPCAFGQMDQAADPAQRQFKAQQIADDFIAAIPELRRLIALDVKAAYEGDPASASLDENILCYPGIDAIFSYRIAHQIHQLGVPLVPRVISEYVHNETGIDIHPAAQIGHSFFIDHGTGVVVGQTTVIGNEVKIYQGVTLGALSVCKSQQATSEPSETAADRKRHPTIEDNVIVYANATILGGQTVIGKGSIIGGSVFLTRSVPADSYITLVAPELRIRSTEAHNDECDE